MAWKKLRNEAKRAARRGWPIHGYVGPNGSGKSAAMVWDSLPSLASGRPVLSTVRLLDFENPRGCDDLLCGNVEHSAAVEAGRPWSEVEHRAAHPLWIPFTDWSQLIECEHADVLMDEVTGVASSRKSASMPTPVVNKLVQLRRADVVLRWSAPNWSRSDVIIRECSQAVTYAQGYFPKSDGDSDRLWRRRRLFKWATYDAADFEDFTVGKRESLRPMTVDWHWGPGSPTFSAYDTLDQVLSITTVSDSGTCYRCGGSRPRPRCRCAETTTEAAEVPAEGGAPSGVPVAGPRGGGRRARRDGTPAGRMSHPGQGPESVVS